jgi:hypothetical protein
VTVPRPLSLVVDKSRQILLSALEALRGTETPDGNVYVLHNGGGPLSARLAGGTPIAAYVPPEPATIEHQNLSTTNEGKLIMPGTGTDPKTYTTINEVRFCPERQPPDHQGDGCGQLSSGVHGAGRRLA